MNIHDDHVILIFGYPLDFRHFGGLLWIKKITDYIEQNASVKVRKVHVHTDPNNYTFKPIDHLRAVLEGCFANPKIAILDTYGEAALLMWILLRLFKPSTKIVTVFHHYESLSVRHKNTLLFTKIYCKIIDYLTTQMLSNSDKILTVSQASLRELKNILHFKDSNKIAVVGCSSPINPSNLQWKTARDLEFLCVGRFEKFQSLEDIWNHIKKELPKSRFVIIGRISSKDLSRLRIKGIDHRGIVSEEEKLSLYSRAKVFIFPSVFEGFGMAISEALAAGLSVVAWNLPVFEERFGKESNEKVKLVEIGKTGQFANDVVTAIKKRDNLQLTNSNYGHKLRMAKTWDEVGKDVISVLTTLS